MQTEIALTVDTRDKIAQVLNTVLADEHILYTKLRNYHWNVKGRNFVSLHDLFERQYDQVKLMADEIAERVRMVGFMATGTLKEFLDQTRLEEAPSNELSEQKMIADLLATNEAMIRNLRADIRTAVDTYNDEGTGDLLIQTMRAHEEMAWMLRAQLES